MNYYDISLLYVEDEKILRNVYTKLLENRIKKLYIAENGEKGLQLYKKHKPDLVITDIKMPVMNGLEMTKRIRKEDKNSRMVIMSAYGQTQYFIKAIEHGVKSFLLKPVDNQKLFSLIEELTNDIHLERKVNEQKERRRKAEIALKRSESILKSINKASEQFLQVSFGEQSIPNILESLGKPTGVSRVYIFENHTNNEGELLTSQRYEWVNHGIKPQIDNPQLQNIKYEKHGFKRWVTQLSKNKPIKGFVKDFHQCEQQVLLEQDIASILIVPIFADEDWWGFIGFDDCKKKRIWTLAELKALSTAADILGAAIHRKKVEEELLKLNNELEQRVEERTKELRKEIDERIIAETMLRESEEKYRQIFENANDGIILTMDGIVKFINPKLYEMTGYLPKECISKPFINFIHPEYREMVHSNHIKRLNGEDVPERYDIKILDNYGNVKWIEIKSTLIKWEDSPAVLSFLTDITERKRTAEELHELNQHLEQRVQEELSKIEKQQQMLIQKSKLESLGELAAGIAHEINQPLGGIAMGIDNILIKISENKLSKKYLQEKFEIIFKDIERIRNIINHVRLFSKDQDIGDFEIIEINQVIKDALSMVNTQYRNHNVKMELQLENNIYTYGNKYKLEQVILNLLSNAKDAIDEKESMKTTDNYQKQIKVISKSNIDKLFIEVEDNGKGIPEKTLINVFDPFFTTKQNDKGTGLGLSISYGIIKEMKGDITVDSEYGEYTKMQISLQKYQNKNT